MKRSDRNKIQRNSSEILILIVSISFMILFLFLQLIKKADIFSFIKDFVQINITSSLSIAALVASMGAFRWDHYRKALIEDGIEDKWERKEIMYNKAKLPLYRVIKLNSIFIVMNIITLQSATVKFERINLYYFSFEWKWVAIAFMFCCLATGAMLIYFSMKYMKELIFK